MKRGSPIAPRDDSSIRTLVNIYHNNKEDAWMMISKQTYTFKVVGDCKIQADVYRVADNLLHPVIIWIHGGALITGGRRDISSDQLDLYVNSGYTLVSIDYRLAPETKLEAIIEDIQDACRWIRKKGPELFRIDENRIAVIGHSAGGYLALITGFRVNPRPKALVSFYGYGDIAGVWYSRPDPFYCQQPSVSKEKAYGAVGGPALSGTPGQHNRYQFYLYCRQQGLWSREVTGHDPDKQPMAFDQFCPIRNVSMEYPPTLLLHGDMDTDVPYQQSVIMADRLSHFGIEHELITIPQGGHGFGLAGIRKPEIVKVFERILVFLKHCV